MASSTQSRVWLSREGNTEGPFTEEQLQSLKSSGEYLRYAWFWEENAKAWKPIHPMPAPLSVPPGVAEIPSVSTPASSNVPSAPKAEPVAASGNVASQALSRALSAIGHDNRNIIGGTVDSVIGQDACFKSADHFETFPPFRKGHILWVNLLDEVSGSSENTQAEIVDLKKTDKYWEYRLKWKEVPAMLKASTMRS